MPWRDLQLSPGQSVEVLVEFMPLECGEWCGQLVATASWAGSGPQESHLRESMHIPTYMRVLHSQPGASEIASRLPCHLPRPFRPGSSCRISLDPANENTKQLRTPTPHGSRSVTPATTAATTPVAVATFSGRTFSSGRQASTSRPPRPTSRESSSRPGSGGMRGVYLAQEARPHSVPLTGPLCHLTSNGVVGGPFPHGMSAADDAIDATRATAVGGICTARSSLSAWNCSSVGGSSRRPPSAGRPTSAGRPQSADCVRVPASTPRPILVSRGGTSSLLATVGLN